MSKEKDNKLTLDHLVTKQLENIDELDIASQIQFLGFVALNDIRQIKLNSRIKQDQVSDITKLYLYAQEFNVPFAKDLADNILSLQVSIRGLGRKEMVEIMRSVPNEGEPIENTKGKNIFE